MRTYINIILFVIIIAFVVINSTAYTLDAIVIDITENIITVEDASGNMWELEDINNINIGDTCHMIMYNNRTASIFDDIIVKIVIDK